MLDTSIREGLRRKCTRLASALHERGRRRWAAREALALGHGGIKVVAHAPGLGEADDAPWVSSMAPRAGVGASSRPAAAARGRRAPTAPAPGACPGRRGGSGGGPDDTGRSAGAVALDLAEHPHRGPGAYGPGAAGPPSHRGAAVRRRGLARAGHAHDRRGGGASRSGCPMALSQPRGDRVAACGATGPCRGGDKAGTRGPVGPEGAGRPTAGTAGTRTDARLSGHAARPAVSLGGVRCPAPSGRGQWGERSRPRPRGEQYGGGGKKYFFFFFFFVFTSSVTYAPEKSQR